MAWDPFEPLSDDQQERLAAYERLLLDWNAKINLIARTTPLEEVRERHLLHSLALTQRPFPAGAHVVDYGTGGGLPGLPLAIVYPAATFHLVDSTQKKIRAVQAMAEELGLTNVRTYATRAEAWSGGVPVHYAVSRATAPLSDLWGWFTRVRQPLDAPPEAWPPGLLTLKGGDLRTEVADLHLRYARRKVEVQPLEPLLGRPYFAEKVLLTVQ